MQSTLIPAPAPIPTRFFTHGHLTTLAPYRRAMDFYGYSYGNKEGWVESTTLHWAILDAIEKGIEFNHGTDIAFGISLFRELFWNRLDNVLKTLTPLHPDQGQSLIGSIFDTALHDASTFTRLCFRKSWLFGLFHTYPRPLKEYSEILTELYRNWESIPTVYTHFDVGR
jgi:hypothetical protein